MSRKSDLLLRSLYSTDASMYQIQPLEVRMPRNKEEVLKIIKKCSEQQLPILARGAGTSLTGQAINQAVILDMSKHMTRMLELNIEEKWVRVEPGIVCGELNAQLESYRLHFAPDPATLNRATIGGMIANNSAGMRSIRYGMTIDHVISIELALEGGDILSLGPLSEEELKAKCCQDNREGEIYRGICKLIEQNRNEIESRYPKVIRRSGGYALDALINKPWNLAKLICGSEGTLGVIIEAKLKLSPLPKYSAICLAHFNSLDASLRVATAIVEGGATAVELIDGVILEQARKHPLTRHICSHIRGKPASVLVIETQGNKQNEVICQIQNIAGDLSETAYASSILTEVNEIREAWQMRASALGLMTTLGGRRKPTPYIEDAAIPLNSLADYVTEVLDVCHRYEQPVSLFGHVSVGLVHIRPLHDLHHQEDIEQMKKIQAEVFPLVQKYGGSWSGEHGDGIVRGAYNEAFFGKQLYNAFGEIKRLFDPKGQVNPGRILETPDMDKSLRFGVAFQGSNIQSMFHYREQGDMLSAVEQCTGVGACRKSLTGVMCPSYMATKDEIHSTRGRANALRFALSGQLGEEAISSNSIKDAMDICLACKGCKGECPNSVDMVRLKAEVLYHHKMKHGVSLRNRLFYCLPLLGRFATGFHAPLINRLTSSQIIRKVMEKGIGITAERALPSFTQQRLSDWFIKEKKKKQGGRRVILFNDIYMEYFEPNVGRAAIECLEAVGYDVTLVTGDSQRIAITHGLLDIAKNKGTQLFHELDKLLSSSEVDIVVCEPSCASSLSDDLPDLLDDEHLAKKISGRVMMIDHFLEREMTIRPNLFNWKPIKKALKPQFLIHSHCHQKTLDGAQWSHSLLKRIPGAMVEDTEAGCCGMAGAFGYEKEHIKISKRIAKQRLLPKLNEKSKQVYVVSNGFSCRHQIADLTAKKPYHIVEVLQMFL